MDTLAQLAAGFAVAEEHAAPPLQQAIGTMLA